MRPIFDEMGFRARKVTLRDATLPIYKSLNTLTYSKEVVKLVRSNILLSY